jgi:hypothetical protein
MSVPTSLKAISPWTSSSFDFLRSSILEPIVLLQSLAASVRAIALLQIIQDKVCLQTFLQNDEYCSVLSTEEDSSIKDRIVASVSIYTTFKEILVIVPGIITALFIGSWCDKFSNGKRYCLLSTTFCQFFESCLFLLNTAFMESRKC